MYIYNYYNIYIYSYSNTYNYLIIIYIFFKLYHIFLNSQILEKL